MQLNQNDAERLRDAVDRGVMTADEANVQRVLMSRVLLVTSSLPTSVRRALNAAARDGRLCHVKKNGRQPEAYYHPSFDYLANSERREYERQTLLAMAGVLAN